MGTKTKSTAVSGGNYHSIMPFVVNFRKHIEKCKLLQDVLVFTPEEPANFTKDAISNSLCHEKHLVLAFWNEFGQDRCAIDKTTALNIISDVIQLHATHTCTLHWHSTAKSWGFQIWPDSILQIQIHIDLFDIWSWQCFCSSGCRHFWSN